MEYGICPTCGYEMFPVLPQLPCGHEVAPMLEALDEPGIVYSWTRVWLDDGTSRVIAMVDFREGRVRVTAPVLDDDVEIGSSLRIRPGTTTPYAFVAA